MHFTPHVSPSLFPRKNIFPQEFIQHNDSLQHAQNLISETKFLLCELYRIIVL